jgi:hypothetical protein
MHFTNIEQAGALLIAVFATVAACIGGREAQGQR